MIDSGIPTIPTIVLGADHAGYKLKEAIKNYLIETEISRGRCGHLDGRVRGLSGLRAQSGRARGGKR